MSHGPFSYEIVIVGGGPAGLAAACAAAESGKAVAVLDDTPWLGGQIWRGQQANPIISQARQWLERFRRSRATLLDSTSVVAAPCPGVLLAEHPDGPREIHWNKLIVATGARELFLPFPGWTLPGVMGPGGLQAFVKNGWPVRNQRIVIAGTGPLLLAVAYGLRSHGAEIVAIAEQTPWLRVLRFGASLAPHPSKVLQASRLQLSLFGVPQHYGTWPVRAEGEDRVGEVTLTDGARTWRKSCDLLACGFGLIPNVELPLAMGCELLRGFVRVDPWQTTSVKNVYCAGEPTGIGGADCALVEGIIAGHAASGQTSKAEALFGRRESWHRFRAALAAAYALRPELKTLAREDTLLCRCEDVTFGRVRQFQGWRDAKLQSRCGMGPCQGRLCGAAARVIFGWGMESVRPPVLPARVRSLISQETEDQSESETQPKEITKV